MYFVIENNEGNLTNYAAFGNASGSPVALPPFWKEDGKDKNGNCYVTKVAVSEITAMRLMDTDRRFRDEFLVDYCKKYLSDEDWRGISVEYVGTSITGPDEEHRHAHAYLMLHVSDARLASEYEKAYAH